MPHVGEFWSNQISVFTGYIIILIIGPIFVRWIGATRPSQLFMVGAVWLGLTVAFKVLFGQVVVGLSWERLATDYNVVEGGLIPLGLLVLLLSPWIGRRVKSETVPEVKK